MKILGISAYYHDSAAALIDDGDIVAAAQEERFSRLRHDADFPRMAVQFCLERAGIGLSAIDRVVFYEKPFLTFERLMSTYAGFAPRGWRSFVRAAPVWIKRKVFLRDDIIREFREVDPGADLEDRIRFTEHLQSHAASAFFPSPFDEALILTMDGVGEWATTSVAVGHGSSISFRKEISFPHSLGLLYSAFTYYLGFRVNSGEYKVMGLAPYGEPVYVDTILKSLIDLKDDGSYRLDMRYFDYCTGTTMTNRRFDALFGHPRRASEDEPLEVFHMDVAASIQAVLDQAVMRIAQESSRETGIKNLCLAGGVALNCVTNGHLRRSGLFDGIWVQPAAGVAGGALGAALAIHHVEGGERRSAPVGYSDHMKGAYLGPEFSQREIENALTFLGAEFEVLEPDEQLNLVINALKEGAVVGWFQGRMEYGPWALGARSILACPRRDDMRRRVNMQVKQREGFRPFAPAVPRENVGQWFALEIDSPYMLFVDRVIGARTWEDGPPTLRMRDWLGWTHPTRRFPRLPTWTGRPGYRQSTGQRTRGFMICWLDMVRKPAVRYC